MYIRIYKYIYIYIYMRNINKHVRNIIPTPDKQKHNIIFKKQWTYCTQHVSLYALFVYWFVWCRKDFKSCLTCCTLPAFRYCKGVLMGCVISRWRRTLDIVILYDITCMCICTIILYIENIEYMPMVFILQCLLLQFSNISIWSKPICSVSNPNDAPGHWRSLEPPGMLKTSKFHQHIKIYTESRRAALPARKK